MIAVATQATAALVGQCHEVRLETNVFELRLICHALEIEQTAWGDPDTGKLRDARGVEVTE